MNINSISLIAVEEFHYLSHIFISLIGAILLISIYYTIRKRFKNVLEEDETRHRVDKGLLYLSLSMFVWVASGILGYFYQIQEWDFGWGFEIGVNVLSTINNLFLLLALFYFEQAPALVSKNEKNIKRLFILVLIVAISSLVISLNFSSASISLSGIPDLLLSGFLSILLGITLFRTFYHRGLKIVGFISVLVIALIFVSQLPEVFPSLGGSGYTDLVKIVAKTSLISIFLVLATTWVIELSNTPKITEIQLRFLDWSLVELSIPSKAIFAQTVDFGSKTTQFKNLLKFAIRRKLGDGNTQAISIGNGGELSNQSYLTRIIENINVLLEGDDDSLIERKDLFTFLGEGKYRLRVLPQNIFIEENLKKEFVEGLGSEEYALLL